MRRKQEIVDVSVSIGFDGLIHTEYDFVSPYSKEHIVRDDADTSIHLDAILADCFRHNLLANISVSPSILLEAEHETFMTRHHEYFNMNVVLHIHSGIFELFDSDTDSHYFQHRFDFEPEIYSRDEMDVKVGGAFDENFMHGFVHLAELAKEKKFVTLKVNPSIAPLGYKTALKEYIAKNKDFIKGTTYGSKEADLFTEPIGILKKKLRK